MSNRTHLHHLRTKLYKAFFRGFEKVYNLDATVNEKSPLEFLTDNTKVIDDKQYEWPLVPKSDLKKLENYIKGENKLTGIEFTKKDGTKESMGINTK